MERGGVRNGGLDSEEDRDLNLDVKLEKNKWRPAGYGCEEDPASVRCEEEEESGKGEESCSGVWGGPYTQRRAATIVTPGDMQLGTSRFGQ